MPTLSQQLYSSSERKKDNSRTRGLKKNPQIRGWVHRLSIVTPKKPNSARRPVIKAALKRKIKPMRLTAHIPGIGHTLKKFSKILLRGRGPRDLPGVRYSGVRGALDFLGLKNKKRRRSIYGATQNDLSKIRARRKYRMAIRTAENDRIRQELEEKTNVKEPAVQKSIFFFNNFFFFKKKKIYLKFNYNLEFFNFANLINFNFDIDPTDYLRFFFFFNSYLLFNINYIYTYFFFFKKTSHNFFFIFFYKNIFKSKNFFTYKGSKTYFFNKIYFLINFNFNFNFFLNKDKYFIAHVANYKHARSIFKYVNVNKTNIALLKQKFFLKKKNNNVIKRIFHGEYFEDDDTFLYECNFFSSIKTIRLRLKKFNFLKLNFSAVDKKKNSFFLINHYKNNIYFFKKNNISKKIKYF